LCLSVAQKSAPLARRWVFWALPFCPEPINLVKREQMRSRFAIFFVALALLQILGGHLAVFQVTAWVGMLVKYSAAEGVEVGISKTFDGKHPCDLCLSIAKNKQTEKKQSTQLDASKIYLVAHAQRWMLEPPRYSWRLRTTIASLMGCNSSPPVPPPRVS